MHLYPFMLHYFYLIFPKYLLTLFDNFCLKFMVWVTAGDWLETAWGCWFILRDCWHTSDTWLRDWEARVCRTPHRPPGVRTPVPSLSLFLGPVSCPPLLWAMIKVFKIQSSNNASEKIYEKRNLLRFCMTFHQRLWLVTYSFLLLKNHWLSVCVSLGSPLFPDWR